MMVENKKKEKTKEEEKKEVEGGKGGRGWFWKSKGMMSQWKEKRKKKQHLNVWSGLVWFRLNGLGSSQNGQNSLIHNWCIGGCWVTVAP
jgi:hypothetical protein